MKIEDFFQECFLFATSIWITASSSPSSKYADGQENFSAEYSLSFADSVIYATARFHNALLISSDVHFEGLPDVKFFSKKLLN